MKMLWRKLGATGGYGGDDNEETVVPAAKENNRRGAVDSRKTKSEIGRAHV